jgi:hypothetical protein
MSMCDTLLFQAQVQLYHFACVLDSKIDVEVDDLYLA